MFSKIIKKSPPVAEVIPQPQNEAGDKALWQDRLKAATGNDTELLALAIEAPSVDQKLACVQALLGEEALKAAEREFRKRDRRVHSLAKQRYETLVKQRETRARAAELTDAAAALVEAPIIPANRLIELKQAWELLPHELLEDEHRNRFTRLQADLSELVRERGERARAANRWSVSANEALEKLKLACAGVATDTALQELVAMFAAASDKAQAALADMPASLAMTADDAVNALAAEIRSALQDLTLIDQRLAILRELHAAQSGAVAAANEESGDTAERSAVIERWKTLPPLAGSHIEKALNARFEDYWHYRDSARKKLEKQKNEAANESKKAAKQANIQALKAAADATEAALAAGHLAEAAKQLATLQKASGKDGVSAELHARIGSLQSQFSRLKGWQQWGGGRARDELVLEAEALAASTVAPEGAPPVKVSVKNLADSIEQLRNRWKELDRLGGATSKSLWDRFDAALKTAYGPVAAHLAKLKEARRQNLAARSSLLDALDAMNVNAEGSQADWRGVQRALLHFETEWRKLGPVEHTVPHKAKQALLDRMKVTVARLEEPLKQVQTAAQEERGKFISRAKSLSQEAQSRDVMAKLRELQSQWQNHARSMPLPRKIENTLWAEFKAATDALMSQRQAAMNARDAELKANEVAREALIVKLEELNQDTAPAEIKRVLGNVDAEWHKAGDASRNQAGKLESRYRAAREKANEYIAGSAQRAWQRTCDALAAKLALCEEMESATPPADSEARWKELPVLPARWEESLQKRFSSGAEDKPADSAALDQLLLQLEAALEIPSSAAFQAARQALKLLALKNAMEGRKPANSGWPEIEKMTADAIGYKRPGADQRSRLQSVVAALRRSGPAKKSREV